MDNQKPILFPTKFHTISILWTFKWMVGPKIEPGLKGKSVKMPRLSFVVLQS